jgi:hypothetical protein
VLNSDKNISVFLYSDYPSKALRISQICDYLITLGIKAEYLGNYFKYLNLSQHDALDLSRKMSSIHISDIEEENEYFTSDSDRIENEHCFIDGKKPIDIKILYDGSLLSGIYFSPLIKKHPDIVISSNIHIVITGRLFCTYGGKRYHARVILTGIPALISTSGLVEAPAKPREYYWLKADFIQSGKNPQELNDLYKERFIEYDDPKITAVLYSYTLQPIFYNLTGEAFCNNSDCCLYNSHWQEEVLSTQLKGKLCDKHKGIIEFYKRK